MIDDNKVEVRVTGLESFAKPVEKLIQAVSSAVGNLCDPEAIKARAEARGTAFIIRTKVKIEAASLWEKAKDRLQRKEERRQRNIEAVIQKAITFMPESVDTRQPDEDWICQFFEHAQDVGDDEMQTIWSKLLTGEVSTPGKYSLLTLAKLKTMGRREASLFTDLATCIWNINEGEIHLLTDIYDPNGNVTHSFADIEGLLCLDLHGLVQFQPLYAIPIESTFHLEYYGRRHYLNHQISMTDYHDHIETHATLIEVGKELLGIAGGRPDYGYMDEVLAGIEGRFPVTISGDD